MIAKILTELDKVAMQALKGCAQPIGAGADVSYEAGRRIGVTNGISLARQAVVDLLKNDAAKDNDL